MLDEDTGKWRCLMHVNAKSVVGGTHTHGEVATAAFAFAKKKASTKAEVVQFRDAMLKKRSPQVD